MFRISPIQDKAEQERVAKACGAEYKEELFAYAMTEKDSGKIMGFSQFELTADCGFISDLRSAVGYEDYEAMFILGRATMNFIDLCGNHFCRASNDAGDERLLHAIGFRKAESGYWECDMTGMFDGHCAGEKENLQ